MVSADFKVFAEVFRVLYLSFNAFPWAADKAFAVDVLDRLFSTFVTEAANTKSVPVEKYTPLS